MVYSLAKPVKRRLGKPVASVSVCVCACVRVGGAGGRTDVQTDRRRERGFNEVIVTVDLPMWSPLLPHPELRRFCPPALHVHDTPAFR